MKIECEGLAKSFGELNVLKNVSFAAETGRPVAVTGPSGSGKTTLLRILMGLETADGGRVRIPEGTRFAAVFQEDRLFEELDATENVRLASGVHDRERIRGELLRLLPEEALTKPVRQLSGGQRRRVAVVRACLAAADALIMDEPFSGLDAESARRTAEYIRRSAEGKILILAAHGKDVPEYCQQIIATGAEGRQAPLHNAEAAEREET